MWPNKPLEFVKLANDNSGLHYGLFFKAELVSVVSVFLVGKEMQFRKFATKEAFQNKGFGAGLLNHVFDLAEIMQVTRIWCNARHEKRGYYEKFGMRDCSETFKKSGILYITMEKKFDL